MSFHRGPRCILGNSWSVRHSSHYMPLTIRPVVGCFHCLAHFVDMGRGLRAWDVTSRNLELYQRSAVPRQAYPGTTPSDYGSDVERRRWVLFSCEAEVRPRIDQDVCLIPPVLAYHTMELLLFIIFSFPRSTCMSGPPYVCPMRASGCEDSAVC